FCPSLLLFSSPALEGDWRYHPSNPLTGDLNYVRNGGAIVQAAGKLYRPSQSSRGGYGTSFSLHEITRLDPKGYEERLASTTQPPGLPNLIATHTYARGGGWECIDGCFYVPARSVR